MSLWSRFQRRLGDLAEELVLDDYRSQLEQAKELLSAGDVLAAIDTLEALLVAKPDHGHALILLGEARLVGRDPERALAAFERALAQRGGDPAALVGHGLALVMLARFEAAIAPLGRAVAEAGGDRQILADAYRGLGIAWRRAGDLDKAIRELRKAVTEDNNDLDARAALGEALIADHGVAPAGVPSVGRSRELQAIDEAMRHLERAAAADAPPVLALYGLGIAALLEDTPAIAAEYLARARSFAVLDTTPLGRRVELDVILAQGDAALAQRDAMGAQRFFFEALQSDPRRGDLHAKIAAAHRAIGNLDAALASFDRALALGPLSDNGDVLRAAVDTAIAAGDSTRCLQWGNDLLGRAPDDVRALVARGLAMIPSSPEAARAMLELAAARDDVDAHIALARMSLAADPAAAARSALAALRVAPHHAKARELLTDARAGVYGVPGEDIGEVVAFLERLLASRRELGHLVGDVSRAGAALDQPLLVTVMGEFSSGKSSFVNAFIGADVAPTGITPTTATINVVRYGRERGGRIVARDGTAIERGWDDMMSYLRALTPDAAREIDRVEILVPLPQLETINIVDTPGLNSIQPEHEATARAFIAKADAVVWVFTAAQGGKASEKKALRTIRDEGKRVLGVLNKADQLSASDTDEVTAFIGAELADLVECIVPFSARRALAWKRDGGKPVAEDGVTLGMRADGNWGALIGSLETRFFQQARSLKRDACVRALRHTIADAQHSTGAVRDRLQAAAADARGARDELITSARTFADDSVLAERKALSDQTATLYRRAAREVLDLVRPRRLPFSSHTATTPDRDYLIGLLQSGYDAAIEAGRRRVADGLLAKSKGAEGAARTLASALGADVIGDLQRTTDDRIGLALSRVFDRARAYLRGYLEGGYVEAFFRNDVPRLTLAEDDVYHALVKTAPDIDHELADPLARAATDALTALARRIEHWGAVADVQGFDLEAGIGRALELAAVRVG
ncbi:MAG: dynamin family protein [Deltaproteobacteria bacterium]|nr:dynamin family protein [Deltaproteobacteria bacterium]